MARTELYRRLRYWLGQSLAKSGGEYRDGSAASMSRRRLLTSSTQIMVWSSLPACVTPFAEPLPPPLAAREEVKELIIIGGGLAGLTAAYQLAKAGIRVRVYEGAERLGGRVYTATGFNADGMFCERGAEFVDTGHEDLIQLASELGVPLQPLTAEADTFDKEAYFFGGRLRTEKEVIKAFRPLSKILQRDLQSLKVKGEFQMPTCREVASPAVKALDHLSLDDYLQRCQTQVDAWLLDLVRVAYVGEYGLEAAEQSALNLLVLISPDTKAGAGLSLYGESDEAFRIQGGSEELVQALVRKLAELGVSIWSQHVCVAVKGRAQGHTFVFKVEGRTLEVNCAEAIMALPLPILRQLEGLDGLALSPIKKKFLAELGFGSNSKLMLGFKQRYWRQKNHGFPAHSGALYTEGASQAYWDTSRQQHGQAGILTNFLGGKAGLAIGPGKVPQSLGDLERVMPGIAAEHDGQRILQHWSSVPWARGSYTCPMPGQYTTLIGAGGGIGAGG